MTTMKHIVGLLFCLVCVNVVQSWLFSDDPCYLTPTYESGIPADGSWNTTIHVAHGCYNGTFDWNYPRGFVLLDFTKYNKPVSICFTDSLGGEVFTITDKIHDVQLDPLRRGSAVAVCTSQSSEAFVIRVDAPEWMTYMGEFKYELMFFGDNVNGK